MFPLRLPKLLLVGCSTTVDQVRDCRALALSLMAARASAIFGNVITPRASLKLHVVER